MKNFEEKLTNYAKLCIKVGINVQEGEPLVIRAPIETARFVRLLAKHAYEAGATDVYVHWSDETLTKLKYEHAPMEIFENFPNWLADSYEDYAKQGAGFLSIYAEDPELLKDVDPKKIAAYNRSSAMALKEWRKYTMNDINSWCVVSVPTKSWAKRIFPNLNEDEAVDQLWQAIFKATRMDLKDPVAAWQKHIAGLEKR